jgi:hypothetical protein
MVLPVPMSVAKAFASYMASPGIRRRPTVLKPVSMAH